MSNAYPVTDTSVPAGTSPLYTKGSYINTERRFQVTNAALQTESPDNRQIIEKLASVLETDLGFNSEEDIVNEMSSKYSWYRNASEGEIIDGVLIPEKKTLVPVEDDKFIDKIEINALPL